MTEFFINGQQMDSRDEFIDAINAIQDEMVSYIKSVEEEYNVTNYCAGLIVYLRSRSRWTEEKEQQLIYLDQTGQKLPDVLSGEF